MRHDHPALKSSVSALTGALLAAALSVPAAAAPGSRESGVWFNHTGKGAVEIRPCGAEGREAKRLCGFIVWLKEPNNKRGEPLTDGYNPEPSKRRRPICGLPVLGNLQAMSDGGWDLGWVYDPEQGKQFDAAIELSSPNRLILTGYKGVKFFSKSFVWKRAPDDLPRCDQTQETRAPGEAVKTNVKAARASGDALPSAHGSGAAHAAHAAQAVPPLPDRSPRARQQQAQETQAPQETGEAQQQFGGLTPPAPTPAVRPGTAVRQ